MANEYINGIKDVPGAVGPYSQAVKNGNMLFLSGQIALNPATGQLVGPSIEEQANQVLKNIKSLLVSQQLDFSNVVKSTIFLTDMADFKVVNSIYEKWLGECRPARSTVQVSGLPLGGIVEIEMIAVFSK